MSIPLTKSFTIEHENIDGTILSGEFITHKLTMAEKVKVGVIKGRLTDGIVYESVIETEEDEKSDGKKVTKVTQTAKGLETSFNDYAEAIAYCKVSLTKAPPWFDVENIQDDRLLWKVYREVSDLESAIFRAEIDKRSGEQEENTDQESEPENTD